MDADVKVGIVADAHRQMHRAVGGAVQIGLGGRTVLRIGQQARHLQAQGLAQAGRGQDRLDGRRHVAAQARGDQGGKLDDMVADGDARARRLVGRAEQAKRQVLDRKVGVAEGVFHPGYTLRVVGFINHGSFAFSKPSQQAS